MEDIFLNEHRCQCGKLLLKGTFFDASLEIKCKKCGIINNIGDFRLLNDSSHYYLTINKEGIFTSISSFGCEILKYKKDEVIGKHFTFLDPNVPKDFTTKFFTSESILNGDDYFQVETTHRTKSGLNLPVRVLLRVQKINDKEKNVLATVELKEITKIEKKFENCNNKFIDNQCDFYFSVDKTGVITYISPGFSDFIGFSQMEVIGKSYLTLEPVESREEAQANFEYFSSHAEPYKRPSHKNNFIDKKLMYYDLYFTPKFNDRGEFIGYSVLGSFMKKGQ